MRCCHHQWSSNVRPEGNSLKMPMVARCSSVAHDGWPELVVNAKNKGTLGRVPLFFCQGTGGQEIEVYQ